MLGLPPATEQAANAISSITLSAFSGAASAAYQHTMRRARSLSAATGQPPSHADWICLATAGRDGKTIAVRGTFDQSASYRRLDVVALNGGSFVALKDKPGPCPGPGWQLIASPGRRGAAG
jgi:hypothetical protein